MATIQAQDVVNAVIQDSQNQTTNRPALYDYVDRVHQRILRESQWRFLLSDPQTFVTMPGVSSYTLVNGTAPAGSFATNLALSDFANIAPGSVYNLTTFTKIEEDSDNQTSLNYIINRDGSLRYGPPRTYANRISSPGTIDLKPVPDQYNVYYPVPETPVVTYAAGGSLPARIYYGVVTFVDSLGGESTPCVLPFTIAVPAGCIVTVSSPNATMGNVAGNQATYGWWNLYIGYAVNAYNRQNFAPIQLGTSWTEPILGIATGTLQVPSNVALSPSNNNTILAINASGQLITTKLAAPVLPAFWALVDSNNAWWAVITNATTGMLQTVSVPVNANTTSAYSAIYLTDTSNISTWKLTVTTGGQLVSTLYSTPPTTAAFNGQPPTVASIQPLNAYVIQFRYYKARNVIANPTDVLQIPYQYKDIVIAGVNYLANMYMDLAANAARSEKTAQWKRDFEAGLAQIRRDLRVSYRKTDFIGPDTMSQYVVANQQGIPTMGWSWVLGLLTTPWLIHYILHLGSI